MSTTVKAGTTDESVTLAPIVEALHATYDALVEHVRKVRGVEMPRAVFVVQRDARAWGHITTRPAWQADREVLDEDYEYVHWAVAMGLGTVTVTDHFHEIMVSGENLARGGREVFGTVAHEAAHAYNLAVGQRDVDVNGRHNRVFAVAAQSLFGLTIEMHAPNHWAGWTKTTVGLECAQRWRDQITAIDAAITAAAGRDEKTGGAGGGFGGFVLPPMPTGRDKNNLRATCGCGSIIRASQKVLTKGVVCASCGGPFVADRG